MRMAGHPQQRETRPRGTVRQDRNRAAMIARAVAVALMLVGIAFGAWAAVTAPSADGRTLLAVILILASYYVADRYGDLDRRRR